MAKEEKKGGVILYYEYEEHFKLLSREEIGDLVIAMLEYSTTGEVTTELSDLANMAFSFIKRQMNRDAEKYQKTCQKNAANGSKGGRPKKESADEESDNSDESDEKPNGFSENPEKPNGNFEKPKKAIKKEKEKEKEKENKNTHSLSECVNAHTCAREDTPAPVKKAYGKYENVLLTEEEYADVRARCAAYLDIFSEKLKHKGYKFDNHYAILLQWASEHGMIGERPVGNFDIDKAFESAVRKTAKRNKEKKYDLQNTG